MIGGFGPIGPGQRRDGIDIAAREGAPVLAAEDGIVAYAGDGIRTLGRLILIRHDEGYITTYAHNAALLVEAGDAVARGQVIARVGSTGDVTRSQLHFEIRKGRKPIDRPRRSWCTSRPRSPALAAEDGIAAYAATASARWPADPDPSRRGASRTYAHNAALLVEAGAPVERGQVIAGSARAAMRRADAAFRDPQGPPAARSEAILVHEPTAVASTQ